MLWDWLKRGGQTLKQDDTALHHFRYKPKIAALRRSKSAKLPALSGYGGCG